LSAGSLVENGYLISYVARILEKLNGRIRKMSGIRSRLASPVKIEGIKYFDLSERGKALALYNG
jgi:hypothetical protein